MKKPLLFASALLGAVVGFAAPAGTPPVTDDAAYVQTTIDRADKIVAKLGIADATKAAHARDLIAQFYRDLHALQAQRDAAVKAARDNATLTKEARDTEIKAARDEVDRKRDALHHTFISALSGELSAAQVDDVKDGLTYGVLPLTFRVYQEMLPNLTDEQKNQIHAWLVEAREHAMDGFTSEEKHGWFGKYKGRINNYLAKFGYDMKAAEKELAARHKAAK